MKSREKHQGSSKFSLRLFSFVLSLLLLVTALPPIVLPSYAVGQEAPEESSSEEAAYTYTEIEELREESVKHFRRSDGKQVAILYAEPVHAEENGMYVDLDNRLMPGADGRYQTVNEKFRVFLGKTAEGTAAAVPSAAVSSAKNRQDAALLLPADREAVSKAGLPAPVEVRYEGYSLSWHVSAVKRPTLTVTGGQRLPALSAGLTGLQVEGASGASKAELAAVPVAVGKVSYTTEEIGSSFSSVAGLTYRDAFGSEGKVDLAYTVAPNRLEEDIIVKGRGDIDRYVLQMRAPGLTAVLEEDWSISFQSDAGEIIFTIGAPWMCDSADAFSEAIGVTLDQQGESVTVVYTPDREWLNSSDRVYPVRIDPSVRTRGYKSYIDDTYVKVNQGSFDYSKLSYTVAGKEKGIEFETYTKIKVLPSVLDAMDVSSITMNYFGTTQGTKLRMKLIDTAWSISGLADKRPEGTGVAYAPTITPVSGKYHHSFNFYSAFREYADSHSDRNQFFKSYLKGFRLYGIEEVAATPRFDSVESATPEYRPYLEIVYTYAHDIPVVNNGIYSLRNAASGKYLTVNASDDNAYQYSKMAGSSSQAFRFVGGEGCFKLQPLSRSGKALGYDYVQDGLGTTNGYNVMGKPDTDANADKTEFLLEYVDTIDGYDYYALVSRADTSQAIQAVGTVDGSMSGTVGSSPGNIYMYTYNKKDRLQLWTLESGGQPVFIGNNIVEENDSTLTYNAGVGTAVFQPYCYVTEFGDTIHWSSSNSFVATVNSGGKITIQNIGVTTVSAEIRDSAGVMKKRYSYRVVVLLEDGVYYLRNLAVNQCLAITASQVASALAPTMQNKITSGNERFSQLWKIYHLGDGYYSIRSMRDLEKGLGGSSAVRLFSLGMTDTKEALETSEQWTINMDGSFYRIRSRSDNKSLAWYNKSLQLRTSSSFDGEYWRLEKVSLSEGVYITQSYETITMGAPKKFSAICYTRYLQSQTPTWSSSNSSIVSVNASGFVSGKARGKANITVRIGTKSATIPVEIQKKAVIIIPGFMGSELYAGEKYIATDYEPGTPLFTEELIDSANGGEVEALRLMKRLSYLQCDYFGKSGRNVIVRKDYNNNNDRTDDDYYGYGNTYKTLFDELKKDTFLKNNGYNIEFFSYDWRLSNEISAQSLNSFICNGGYGESPSEGYDKVILVGHSMGGLVASSFLAIGSEQRNKVESIFLLGSPLTGTPVAPYILATEDVEPILHESLPALYDIYKIIALALSPAFLTLQDILKNMSSLYELFPTKQYFSEDYSNQWYLLGSENEEYHSYDETRYGMQFSYNGNLLKKAGEFHDSLYVNGEHISSLVTTYYISSYMVNSSKETIFRIKCLSPTPQEGKINIAVDQYTQQGDTMVPVWSASLGDHYANRTFYIENVGHTALVSNSAVLSFLCSVMSDPQNTSVDKILPDRR